MLNNESREKTITEKRGTTVDNPEFNIVWQGQPAGLMGRILSALHLNFTWYKISKDELIITRGFLIRHTDTIELYLELGGRNIIYGSNAKRANEVYENIDTAHDVLSDLDLEEGYVLKRKFIRI